MAQSQLKRLKASLRTAGVTGQQKPKKAAKNRGAAQKGRIDRSEALASIREEFNPFEIKKTKTKHEVLGARKVKGKEGRPGLSKQVGEENRKRTLGVELQRRNKVGGIIDRRFGENDPTMPPEERMLERFTREKQKRVRNAGGELFNLEDEDELTHFGQSLGALRDDFDAGNEVAADEDTDMEEGPTLLSRKRLLEAEEDGTDNEDEDGEPERKKSKAEVMKEVIAKSKLHKYERQKNKEEMEEEREKLDKEMGSLWALLGQRQPSTTGSSNANMVPLGAPGEASKKEKEKETDYDVAVRELGFDARAKPADKSKTEEEKAAEETERLKKLEDARQRRMRGEEVTDDEDDRKGKKGGDEEEDEEEDEWNEEGEAAAYGLGSGIPIAPVDKFHDFGPDELVEGDYEISEDGYVDVDEDGVVDGDMDVDEEDDSIAGSAAEEDSDEEDFITAVQDNKAAKKDGEPMDPVDKMAYVFPCPQTHEEMLEITKDIPVEDQPTVVQRIRILHHAKLQPGNKEKLGVFSTVLLEHILHVANQPSAPFRAIDLMTRHLHALAKTYPDIVGEAFREHLKDINENRINSDIRAGDLVLLTAISTIFPTSDHFHQVATPAMIVIAKWLAQVVPEDLRTLGIGAYMITLCVQYQRISKRVVPEALNFIYGGLQLLSPSPLRSAAPIPSHITSSASPSLRIDRETAFEPRPLKFTELFNPTPTTAHTLLLTLISLLTSLSTQYTPLSAYPELFSPAQSLLKEIRPHLPSSFSEPVKAATKMLKKRLDHALHTRRPLELHHHRPLPIPSNIPKFEEDFNPDKKSYDPDVERRELAKLRAEHKRERKGAVRELRKDSQFIAREKLREEKKASKEYHAKMAKIVAQIQTEEGAEANKYEREKRMRRK